MAAPPEASEDDDEYPLRAGEHGWLNLVEVVTLPSQVSKRLQELAPGYRLDHSRTAGLIYWLNHCTCGAKLGDHFLHSEPDGPFFGEETQGLEIWVVTEPIAIESSYSEGPLGSWIGDQITS